MLYPKIPIRDVLMDMICIYVRVNYMLEVCIHLHVVTLEELEMIDGK